MTPHSFLIRRCTENPNAWAVVLLWDDGDETDIHSLKVTAATAGRALDLALNTDLVRPGDTLTLQA